jgi:hypothetical protein
LSLNKILKNINIKNMKNIKLIITTILIVSGLTSCRDESKNLIPELKHGVTFVATLKSSPFLDLAKADGAKLEFETNTTNPELISKVDVMAELVPASGARITKPLVTLGSTIGSSSIPFTQIFTALGITPSQLKPGDVIRAKFVATTPDGRTFSEENTVGTLPTTGSSGFTRALNVTVACVFDAAQFATGKWIVDVDDWGDIDKGKEISVVPGPGVNELTIDFYGGPAENYAFVPGSHKPSVITISNLNTGGVTVPKQAYGIYDGDPATYSIEGTGNVSGCAGTIELILKHTSTDGYSSSATPTLKFRLVRK